jgi:4-cresol dehydrogenase (hydroxylating)
MVVQPRLPDGLNESSFQKALRAFEKIVGAEWVLATESDRHAYLDAYALGDGLDHAASAALAPASADEVQALVRVANEHKVPLWPVGRGKNLGYGAAAPVTSGTVVLDLGRMNRILNVDEKFAHCLLEPGVGFFDLYNHLTKNDIKLWMSVPGNAWGSVIGNALERGIGYTPYGDHTDQICGLEVVLPQGDLIRTGMGAMLNSTVWQHYRHGFGPAWDQMFAQSNFGIVTKAGIWLQPEPEMSAKTRIHLPRFEDISWAIEVLSELRRRDVIQHNIVFGNYLHDASVFSQRRDWYTGEGAIPDAVS